MPNPNEQSPMTRTANMREMAVWQQARADWARKNNEWPELNLAQRPKHKGIGRNKLLAKKRKLEEMLENEQTPIMREEAKYKLLDVRKKLEDIYVYKKR